MHTYDPHPYYCEQFSHAWPEGPMSHPMPFGEYLSVVHGRSTSKPSRSQVEIKDLGCDLTNGVRLAPLKKKIVKDIKYQSYPQVFYTYVDDDNWADEERSVFPISVESYIKKEDRDIKAEEIWFPFICQYVENCYLLEAFFLENVGNKYRKVIQRFSVQLAKPDDKPFVPYVQFLCGPKRVRHTGVQFKNGDLISIVIKSQKYPSRWPNPPIVTVIPTEEQHFVPMMPKQRMVIVTKKKTEYVDFKPHAESNIYFEGTIESDFDRECSYFHCKKPCNSSEVAFVYQKGKKENKKVVIPFCEKQMRYPIILNPIKDAVIHAQNIDGFVIRFLKDCYHPVMVAPGTPLRTAFTKETPQYIERRYEIDRRKPLFYLRKHDYSWIIT